MKRFSSSDSLGALIYPPEEKNPKQQIDYSREFQAMMDGLDNEDSTEESGQTSEKKRRLSIDQVKTLEKFFEVDNKLDPQRKMKLAQELGLQPRQVAIWFQNRRARWKTKQLERDYNHLKANFDSLKLNYGKVEQQKETSTAELRELKSKLQKKHKESKHSDKEPLLLKDSPTGLTSHQVSCNISFLESEGLVDFKERLSDSDSNGLLNEKINLSGYQSSSRFDFFSPPLSELANQNYFQFGDSIGISTRLYQQQFVKMEDEILFTTDKSCSIFPIDQEPTLYKYFTDA